MRMKYSVLAFVVAVVIHVVILPVSLFSQADFYQGKTITIIQGREPGGSGDMRAKAVIPFLRKYIPGNPTIVSEYMPGGGGRKAANYIYGVARPDGLLWSALFCANQEFSMTLISSSTSGRLKVPIIMC